MGLGDTAMVVQACRLGLGGAEAWGLTHAPGAPRLWLHNCFNSTVRWRVSQVTHDDFLVGALSAAAIPNERLGDQLHLHVFEDARGGEWFWDTHD